MRYFGQNYDTPSRYPGGERAGELTTIVDSFNGEHLKVYGHSKAEEPIELINLRVAIIGA